MLKITGLSAHYGGIAALNGVDLEVASGEIVALLGSNGAGKSTLLGCITASAPCEAAGSIELHGHELLGTSTESIIRAGVVLVPEGRQLFGELTVYENLMMGAYLRPRGAWNAELARVYDLFPVLKERRAQPAQTLSGGEQQMVAMGRALMSRPKLMLMDEPSMGLAPILVERSFEIIKQVHESGVAILVVEQNANVSLSIADRGYVLQTGRIVLADRASALLRNEELRKAYLGR